MECGCYVKHAGGEDSVTPTTVQCPMHEAAEDTLAALEVNALIPCPEWRQNHSDCIEWAEKPCGPCQARKVVAAIAAARGGAA